MPSPLLERSARLFAGLVAATFAAGCTPPRVYEPPVWSTRLERDAGFDSAAMLDATRVVFSWSDGRFRPVAADPLWWKGPREYVRDEKLVGIYDVTAQTGRIVYAEVKERLGDGNGELVVAAARGGFALVLRERTTENGILVDPGGWFVLDLAAGKLIRVDLDRALVPRATAIVGTPALVDDAGTVLARAREREFAGFGTADEPGRAWARPEDRDTADARLLLWVPDGSVRDLGVGQLVGESPGRILIARPDRGGADAIDLATGETRELTGDELLEQGDAFRPPHAPAAVAVADDGSRLWIGVDAVDGTPPSQVAFDVEALR